MAATRPELALSIVEKLAAHTSAMWALGSRVFAIDAYVDVTPEERDLLDSLRNEAALKAGT